MWSVTLDPESARVLRERYGGRLPDQPRPVTWKLPHPDTYPKTAYAFNADGTERRPPGSTPTPSSTDDELPEPLRSLSVAIAFLDRAGSYTAAEHFRIWLMPLETAPGQVNAAMDRAPSNLPKGLAWCDPSGRRSRKEMDLIAAKGMLESVVREVVWSGLSWADLILEDFVKYCNEGFVGEGEADAVLLPHQMPWV